MHGHPWQRVNEALAKANLLMTILKYLQVSVNWANICRELGDLVKFWDLSNVLFTDFW